jgi:SET domain
MNKLAILSIACLTCSSAAVRAFQYPNIPIHSRTCSLFSTIHNVVHLDLDENAVRDFASMDAWATGCGVQRSDGFQWTTDTNPNDVDLDLDILDFEDASVLSTQDLPAWSSVLFVPNQMILSSSKALQEFGRLEEAEQQLDSMDAKDQLPYFYLMVKILWEYGLGQESPWHPWLNSLPRYFSNAASMTPFCYECLPPYVAALARKEQSNFISFYLALKEVSLFDDEPFQGNMPLIKWAFNIAYTRSFRANNGSGDLCMAPMADLFNHGTYSNIALSYDEQGNCYAQTTTDVPAGSPLTMSYGDPTNPSFLFARYGFIDKTSPSTFCKIMVESPPQPLVDMGYDHSRLLFYKDSGEVSPEVWDVLLYQIVDSIPETQLALYQAHVNGDYQTKQLIHQQYFQETSTALLQHIDGFLQQLENLSQKAKGKNLVDHPRLPIILQHNEFVKKTLLAVRRNYFG